MKHCKIHHHVLFSQTVLDVLDSVLFNFFNS